MICAMGENHCKLASHNLNYLCSAVMHWRFGSEIHLVLHLIPNAFTSEVGSSRRPIVVAQGIKDTK